MANGNGIDKGTKISLALVVMVVGGLFSLWAYLDQRFDGIEAKIAEFEHRTEDRWRGTDMRVWALELERLNREIDLHVPDPYSVTED